MYIDKPIKTSCIKFPVNSIYHMIMTLFFSTRECVKIPAHANVAKDTTHVMAAAAAAMRHVTAEHHH